MPCVIIIVRILINFYCLFTMTNFYIPKYFSFSELIVTRHRIPNYPRDFKQIANLCNLCRVILDPLRELIREPIIVNSAFRSPKVNLEIGGASNSFHLDGCAADIRAFTLSPDILFEILKENFPYNELIKYPNFVHIAYNNSSSKHYLGSHV